MRPSRQGSGRPRRPDATRAGGTDSTRPTPFRRKSLGQHHLKSGRTCRPLIDFLGLVSGDRVLEIGPGGGVLTAELLATGARVVALELDPAWAFDLPKRAKTFLDRDSTSAAERPETKIDPEEKKETKKLRLGEKRKASGPVSPSEVNSPGAQGRPVSPSLAAQPHAAATLEAGVFPFSESFSASSCSGVSFASGSPLSIVLGDALEFGWERLDPGWRVAGNLPYNVGTAIVERILGGLGPGARVSFLLQREVVDRIVARPGDDAYGALSVLVAARARAVRLGTVKPGAFVPPPKVESAFVGLETIPPPLPEPELRGLERVIKAAFGQRRKSLRNALASTFGREPAAAMLAAAAIDPGRRAEELGLVEFVRLSSARVEVGSD